MSRLSLFSLNLVLLGGRLLGAAEWSDTFLGFRGSSQYREPGIDGTVKKDILQLGHASGWAYGSNFFNVDVLKSDGRDPAHNSTAGATEVYVVYRGSLSLGKLTRRDLSFGPVRDLSLTAGIDLNSKNTAFAPAKRMWVLGPTFHFKAGRGFCDLGVFLSRERNHNGIVGKEVDFDTTWQLGLAWALPFRTGSLGWKFQGFANRIAPKGKDGFGRETKAETLSDLFLFADLGTAIGGKAGRVFAGLGYEYWNNKFGGANSDLPAPSTNKTVHAPMLAVRVHF